MKGVAVGSGGPFLFGPEVPRAEGSGDASAGILPESSHFFYVGQGRLYVGKIPRQHWAGTADSRGCRFRIWGEGQAQLNSREQPTARQPKADALGGRPTAERSGTATDGVGGIRWRPSITAAAPRALIRCNPQRSRCHPPFGGSGLDSRVKHSAPKFPAILVSEKEEWYACINKPVLQNNIRLICRSATEVQAREARILSVGLLLVCEPEGFAACAENPAHLADADPSARAIRRVIRDQGLKFAQSPALHYPLRRSKRNAIGSRQITRDENHGRFSQGVPGGKVPTRARSAAAIPHRTDPLRSDRSASCQIDQRDWPTAAHNFCSQGTRSL